MNKSPLELKDRIKSEMNIFSIEKEILMIIILITFFSCISLFLSARKVATLNNTDFESNNAGSGSNSAGSVILKRIVYIYNIYKKVIEIPGLFNIKEQEK